MPSKLDPVSSAARTVKKRAAPRRYTKRMMSPGNATSAVTPPNGISAVAIAMAASPITGPARKTHVVVRP
jgi:hypothetical protein